MSAKLLGGRLTINLICIPVALVMCYLNGFVAFAAFVTALVLHESAHGVVASALGVRVSSLELMPFGCTAHIESFALVSGGREITMAAAGPAANIIAAAAVYVAYRVEPTSDYLTVFFRSNVMLAAMNLLPALPLDGGRILSVLLGMAIAPVRAMRLTSVLGVCVASLMLATGIYMFILGQPNPTLIMMGGFMLYGSLKHFRSAAYTFMKNTTGKRDEILKRNTVDVRSLAAYQDKTAGEILSSLDSRKYNMVYVLDDDLRVVREMSEGELLRGMIRDGTSCKLSEVGKNSPHSPRRQSNSGV